MGRKNRELEIDVVYSDYTKKFISEGNERPSSVSYTIKNISDCCVEDDVYVALDDFFTPFEFVSISLNSLAYVIDDIAVRMGLITSGKWSPKDKIEDESLYYLPCNKTDFVEIAPIIDLSSSKSDEFVEAGEVADMTKREYRYASSIGGISISKIALIRETITTAETYLATLKELCPKKCDRIRKVEENIKDAHKLISHYEEHGTFKNLNKIINKENIRRYLFEGRGDRLIADYILDNNLLCDIIEDLRTENHENASKHFDSLLTHPNRQIRKRVIKLLKESPDERAVGGLTTRIWQDLDKEEDHIIDIINILSRIDDEQVVRQLRGVATAGVSSEVRKQIIDTLKVIGGNTAIETLKELSESDSDEDVRKAANRALKKLNNE